MTQSHFFGDAKWVGARECSLGVAAPIRRGEYYGTEGNPTDINKFYILRGRFTAAKGTKAQLSVLGLGFFKCYINGTLINPDTFLPLSSDFEATNDPVDEMLAGHRVYVPQFDITPYLSDGENVIALHFGGGWYTHLCRPFGMAKAIYRVEVESDGRVEDFVSGTDCLIGKSYINAYAFTTCESHDYTKWQNAFAKDFDDSGWEAASLCAPLETDYMTTDCPPDALIEALSLTKTHEVDGIATYDCGQNTTGYPVIEILADAGETVEIYFAEELTADGRIDRAHSHNQRFLITSDGKGRTVQPYFIWYGFRAMEIVGKARPISVKVIHADVKINSTFDSDNETLNWIYNTFLHTMLCNMHTGHPSDCPHLERRGYTGDGQLTTNAVLTTMDARAFYEKWMADIGDCQDTLSGHIQYTAPYIRSGGGPGGWGCAIVEVPYQLYRHYGDKSVLEKYYPQMLRYIDYLEAHSEFSLVTSDKAGEWCLGDWCGPNILYPECDITSHNQQVILPAPYVNTYFMVKSLLQMKEIAALIGRETDIPLLEKKIAERKSAIRAAYFNAFDDNFVMNVQGANAFALDLGLGRENDTKDTKGTFGNLVRYYKKLGHFDTGIFATDVLSRLLFERGEAELAARLLIQNGDQGYEHWRRNGATTFHEYWDSSRSRSHNHPMFGAPVAYIFEHLLGIRQKDGTAGYESLSIEPKATALFGRMAGSIETVRGKIAVAYENKDGKISFTVTIPEGTSAILRFGGKETPLAAGESLLVF